MRSAFFRALLSFSPQGSADKEIVSSVYTLGKSANFFIFFAELEACKWIRGRLSEMSDSHASLGIHERQGGHDSRGFHDTRELQGGHGSRGSRDTQGLHDSREFRLGGSVEAERSDAIEID